MNIGTSYIQKLSELYQIDNSTKASMIENIERIEKEFQNWCWTDIEYAIDLFYTKKNDKIMPRMAQVKAILNTNRKDKALFSPVDARNDAGCYNLPSTSIKIISDAFLSVCRMAHKLGVANIPYFELKENTKCGNDTYIKDGMLRKIRWDWDDYVAIAKERFPETFGKFKNLTKLEEYTFAYKLGVLNV